ncbi:hypothetical protein [Planosporangium mesophilum]|uniref:Uncharacterized protein n=1 Tax=Planosporangium mesophilum TaxID=689768 RepID=A0A8J3WY64_9ACTN|nr:hypothetical protein [Planosporangium mesophilum]NJC81486.1 hypothetical protein [Planosporangium mesophilum]GII20857.1 hypothetical protein Pme01_04540 [Planosporangium mesophilum]
MQHDEGGLPGEPGDDPRVVASGRPADGLRAPYRPGETTDPADRTFRDRLRRRFDTLEPERATKATELDALEAVRDSEPIRIKPASA